MPKQLTAEGQLYEHDFYSWALRQAELLRAAVTGKQTQFEA